MTWRDMELPTPKIFPPKSKAQQNLGRKFEAQWQTKILGRYLAQVNSTRILIQQNIFIIRWLIKQSFILSISILYFTYSIWTNRKKKTLSHRQKKHMYGEHGWIGFSNSQHSSFLFIKMDGSALDNLFVYWRCLGFWEWLVFSYISITESWCKQDHS